MPDSVVHGGKSNNDQLLRKAKSIVYRLLKFRLRSTRELRDKLLSKNLPNPIVEQTIAYFTDLQLVNDRLFAQQWVSSRLKKPFGFKRIRTELKLKGIDAPIIQEVLNEAQETYDEQAVIRSLAQHRASKCTSVDPDKVKQRVYNYLLRRGFNTNIIIKVVNKL